jgi:tetratricopeptide (TPR) repeat protein
VRTSRSIDSIFFIVFAAILLGAGCGRDTAGIEAREDQDPRMVRALARVRADDFDGAIDLYKEIIAEDFDLAKAHFYLGMLHYEKRKDYLRAIYHYETYLELRPETDKRELVQDAIRSARMYYAASLPDQPSAAIEEVGDLAKKLDQAASDLAELQAENRALRRQVGEARRAAASGNRQAAAQGGGASGAEPARAGSESVYVVRSGDTLSRIANTVYRDSNKWKQIYEANRDTLRRPEDLKEGQILRIPRG